MHLDQNGHNIEGPPLTKMNECKEENRKMKVRVMEAVVLMWKKGKQNKIRGHNNELSEW